MDTSGLDKAIFSTTPVTATVSVEFFFRNLRRAGTLKNNSSTITVVPGAHPVSVTLTTLPPSQDKRAPNSASATLEKMRTRDTADMAARASPRKPRVAMPSRSFASRILLVAWRSTATGRSSASMPHPLSETRMKDTPPFWISTVMEVAPASRAFSISSLTTEAGRSTTSPAAIRLATSKLSTLIFPISDLRSHHRIIFFHS